MDEQVRHLDHGTDNQFVTEADWIPGFWNYLLDLDREDLVAELIQNDLDQDATRTVISFEENRLVSEGNGKPVEADGWRRLRKIQGAGDSVPAKRGKIGVKNHGLKTAFTIGDELQLMSGGRAIVQTLYANGRKEPPYPGASSRPSAHPQAPVDGCRVTIQYRSTDVEPTLGEANVLGAVGAQEIDGLFLAACANTPEQFAGIVSPEIVPRYEIVLRHWRLGDARFRFSCTRPRKIGKRIELFGRRCAVSGTAASLPEGLQEQAARRLVPLRGRLRQRVADFFRRGRYFFVEVSWPTDRRGRPRIGTGKFRYPIGYPQGSHEARTGHSAYFNAPIASDNKRHGPARNEATHAELRDACESLLTDVLARHLVPRWGAEGLNPLVPSSGADNHDQAIRPVLSALVNQGAMPVLNWRAASALVVKGRKGGAKATVRRIASRRDRKDEVRYRFVIPVATWAPDRIHSGLSLLCPRSEFQIDPRTHSDIVKLLTDGETSGFIDDFVTFDENDVFNRVTSGGNKYFGAVADPGIDFSEPFVARAYLDLIKMAIDGGKCGENVENELIILCGSRTISVKQLRFEICIFSAQLPSGIPGLHLPSVLHGDLAAHSIFRRKKWRRPKYTMAEFLDGDSLRAASEDTRKLFWQWLCQNERCITTHEKPKLADLYIWPDSNGDLCRISDFCYPRLQRVRAALAGSIRGPHEQVLRSKLASVGGWTRTSIRRIPTSVEIAHWLDTQMARFKVEDRPNTEKVEDLRRFETDIALLMRETTIARLLEATEVTLPALAQDGSIQPRTALVAPGRTNDRLALSSRFLLAGGRPAAALDRLSPPLSAPTATMLLGTFSECSSNLSSLHSRLRQFIFVTKPDDDERNQLAKTPIIPVRGKLLPPSGLAFTGSRGDYWGSWKVRLSGKGLSQDDQCRYLAAGVISALPDAHTSRTFFEWLASQDQVVLQHHIPCVLRHILHRDGPTSWAASFTDTAFIPVESRDGLRLVSLKMARRRPVYLSDADDIGDAIIRRDPAVFLAVQRAKEVAEPISKPLRNLGVRSLREALKEPKSITGIGDVARASEDVLVRLRELQSLRYQPTFRKRLDELGVDTDLVRHDWHDRLRRIKNVCFADEVKARYRFRRIFYALEVYDGFDPVSGIFWMKRSHRTGIRGFCESIAAHLVFKPSAQPIYFLALDRAIELEINDRTFGHPAGPASEPNDGNLGADDISQDTCDSDEDDGAEEEGPGEAVFGHSPFEPDARRNVPEPGPIPSTSSTSRRSGYQNNAREASKNSSHSMPAPELEKRHIEILKRRYASHCQMCLCKESPGVLAPEGSYVEWEEVRRRVVDAHHVDLKSAGGARHAGNLILLCKLHHHNYGRRLTGTAVAAALGGNTLEYRVRFGADSEVKGQKIELEISDDGEMVELFFIDEHAAFWRSNRRVAD